MTEAEEIAKLKEYIRFEIEGVVEQIDTIDERVDRNTRRIKKLEQNRFK